VAVQSPDLPNCEKSYHFREIRPLADGLIRGGPHTTSLSLVRELVSTMEAMTKCTTVKIIPRELLGTSKGNFHGRFAFRCGILDTDSENAKSKRLPGSPVAEISSPAYVRASKALTNLADYRYYR
jgi:hypothetical protein